MALNAYLKLKTKKLGEIKGSVTQKGREGKIMVIAVSHEIMSPRDLATGLPTGKRQHKPFYITKEIDQSTPLLYNALINNEIITDWELQFWRTSMGTGTGTSKENQYYTIKLFNARVVDIRFTMLNTQNPDLTRYAEYEDIAFCYEKITWTWVNGGVTSEDTWVS